MGYGSSMGGGMFFGLLMMPGLVLLLAVTVWVIGGGPRRRGSRGTDNANRAPGHPASPAKQALGERYARGELSAEEYQERLRVLGQND